MTLDSYSPCHCGSGKKFKWCCQPISTEIDRAWAQENNGQHESALRIIEDLTHKHENNAEVWGQKALLLYANEKLDQAEEALEKAFAINPNYPFGLKLRADFRHQEGEIQGALLLARKAADAYDPNAHEALAGVYSLIFDCEMRSNRPIAARAALESAVHLAPGEQQLREALDGLFNNTTEPGGLPAAASRKYSLQAGSTFNVTGGSRLSDVAKQYEELTTRNPTVAANWYNLGLGRAWLGDNARAVEAFNKYLDLETDSTKAVETAALCEVLRCGKGMEDQSDYLEHAFVLPITNPEPIQRLLQEWATTKRLIAIPSNNERMFTGIILETTTTGLVTVGRPAADAGRFAGYVMVVGNLLRISSTVKEAFDRLKEELRQKLGLGLGELREATGPVNFTDIPSEALLFPYTMENQEAAQRKIIDHASHFYEDTWIHRPRKSLNGISPVDAAGHPRLAKKVLGIIEFIAQCCESGSLKAYDFDRLRRKLGLGKEQDTPTAQVPATAGPGDIAAMGAAELAKLTAANLSDEDLEKAYQTAYRLDAQELATQFATTLVGREVQPGKGDRYPWFSFLIQKALRDSDPDTAMDHVNEGERIDCQHNEGRRRNDYELFRATTHAKRGEVAQAQETYQRLIERTPRDFKVRGKAAEAMLNLKQPEPALKFAEDGVEAARKANDRDNEQYMLELLAAAKRLKG